MQLSKMIFILKQIEKTEKQMIKRNEKRLNMDFQKNTPNQMKKASNESNYLAMHIDKLKTDFARIYNDSRYYTTIDEKEYNITGYHKYKH